MDPCHLVPYDITHDALPIQRELLNARIESYLIQHLPLELSPEPVMGDDSRDRLAITIDLVHSVTSADARLDGVKRVRIDVLKNTCLRCYGSEDQDRYVRFLEDPAGYWYCSRTRYPQGSKTFGDVVSAFEKFNILDFSFGLIKGKGYGIVLQSLYRLVRHGEMIERSAKSFLRGPSMHEDASGHVCRIVTGADMDNALARGFLNLAKSPSVPII